MEVRSMKIKDRFEDYLNYLRQEGLMEKTIKEHRRFLYGAISHAILKERKKYALKRSKS